MYAPMRFYFISLEVRLNIFFLIYFCWGYMMMKWKTRASKIYFFIFFLFREKIYLYIYSKNSSFKS